MSVNAEVRKLLHDLRNPLTPLVTGIEILKGQGPNALQQRTLEMMNAQVRQLVELLDRFERNCEAEASAGDEADSHTTGGAAPTGEGPRSILIIDDNPNILAALTIMFEDRGYSVRAAIKAEDAVTLAETFKPDVCLCDISLPTLDGYEAASQLREAHPGMRMFSMSGLDAPEDRAQSKAVGFIAHFGKPFIFDEMIQTIERAAAAL